MWRMLLQTWATQQARARIYETVAQAVQEQQASAAETVQTPQVDVAVVFALPIESGGFADLLEGRVVTRGRDFTVRLGRLDGRKIAIVETGVGPERGARGATIALAGHRPTWVISAGFAGALKPELRRGDIVMANRLQNVKGDRLTIDIKPSAGAKGWHVGALLTVDRIIETPAEKQSLGREHDALAVDMESFAVADVCRRQGVRCLAIRVISDDANECLPRDVVRLGQQQSTPGLLGAVAGAVWRRPGSVKDMFRLNQQAAESADRLGRFLRDAVRQLYPPVVPPAAG